VTLILTCITERFCVQASDRRLTNLKGEVSEEVANKATLLCHFASFAYTGLARISSTEMTDQLLMRCLATPRMKSLELFEQLRREASRSIRQLPLRASQEQRRVIRRTSFVGGGFLGARRPEDLGLEPSPDNLHPFLCVVSNAQDLTESWRPEADREFSLNVGFLKLPDAYMLHVAGQPLHEGERSALERTIRSCVRLQVHPEAIARLLTRTIRDVSARNLSVGPNVMCTFVRREAVESGNMTFTGGPIPLVRDVQSESSYFRSLRGAEHPPDWIFSPADPENPIHFGPNIACDGTQIAGVFAGPSSLTRESAPRPPLS